MATEEIKLNEALEEAGVRVVETDLGEWILQLLGQRPSHIIAPAVHLNRTEIAELFRAESGEDIPDEREALVAYARRRLRQDFAAAEIGVSGVNLGVADTGTLCVMENEGNARLVTALPRIHVAVMGAERVVADWDEAAHILQLLPMAAIGDDASTYVNLITGPRREGETDGPEELHLVILDGGRTALRGTEFEEALSCIRCGACLYSCPMWRTVGGQAYGSPYSGPIGAVITPLLEGVSSPRGSELPFLSSLCGACHDACPVGIPLHDLLVKIRGAVSTPAHRTGALGSPGLGGRMEPSVGVPHRGRDDPWRAARAWSRRDGSAAFRDLPADGHRSVTFPRGGRHHGERRVHRSARPSQGDRADRRRRPVCGHLRRPDDRVGSRSRAGAG